MRLRRTRNKAYDITLLVAGLFLLFLYVTDPYDKLSPSQQQHNKITNALKQTAENGVKDQQAIFVDVRPAICKSQEEVYTSHISDLKVTIIITVPQLRLLQDTLASIDGLTPREHVQEVIAVDHGDMSPKHMTELENMLKGISKGRVVKNNGQGHVSGRIQASKEAQGEVLVFVEAGVRVTAKWLEPLLYALAMNPTSFVMPSFDEVRDSPESTNAYVPVLEQQVPYIARDMSIRMRKLDDSAVGKGELIIPVGTVRREFFAVKTTFFRRIGMLDRDLGDFGGVHQELSLRTLDCEQGSILMHRCSHVGLLDVFNPLNVANPLNIWRISEMWIKSDKWDPFYTTNNRPKNIKESVKESIRIKKESLNKQLRCNHNPDSYITKFLPKLSRFDIKPSDEDLTFQKSLKSMYGRAGGRSGLLRCRSAQQCLSPDPERFLKFGPCDPKKAGVPREQMTFKFTRLSQLKVGDRCVTVVKDDYLRVMDCDNANEKWNYREQQSFVWDDKNGQLKFWFSKECIRHVPDPDPDREERPVVMKMRCGKAHVDSYTFELLY